MNSIFDIMYPYDTPPEEDNFEYNNEDILLEMLDSQFEIRDVNYNKLDLLKKYAYDILKIDIDNIPLYKFEMYSNSEDDSLESFDYFRFQVITLFKKHFGIDLEDLEKDFADFEFIYELYSIFVLDLNNTIAHFMNGVRSAFNTTIQHPEDYTLVGCYKQHLREYSIENNETFKSLEDLIDSSIEVSKNSPVNAESIDMYINSSKAFQDLFQKIIEDDNIFDIDNFFEIIRYSDDNNTFLKLDTYISDGKIPIDVFKFKDRIKKEITLPENIDDLENKYRNLISIPNEKIN